MAHYAFLNNNNFVVEVIVGKDENEDGIDWEDFYSKIKGLKCIRTSYNTRGGIYYDPNTLDVSNDQSKAFRKNYAGIGFYYSHKLDAFIPPKPYDSWLLDTKTCLWYAPIPCPDDDLSYIWDEKNKKWVLIS